MDLFRILQLFLVVVFLACVDCKTQIVDLSHLQNHDSIMWPLYPQYNFTVRQRGQIDYLGATFWLEHNVFQMTEHMGTHIDAPAHFGQGAWRTQQIPVENLMGAGVVINVKDKAAADYDYRIMLSDVMAYENKYGRIPDGAIIMMNSGWYHKYPNKTLIFNTVDHANVSLFHFPGFHEEAVEWLINHRHIHAIGTDCPSFDYGQSDTFPVHVLIAKENVIGVENVANLDKVPESGSTMFLPVIKIDDGSGGPTRVLATYDDGVDKPSSGVNKMAADVITVVFLYVKLLFLKHYI